MSFALSNHHEDEERAMSLLKRDSEVRRLVLVLVLENFGIPPKNWRNKKIPGGSGLSFGPGAQQIEHEHDDEHEHESLTSVFRFNRTAQAFRPGKAPSKSDLKGPTDGNG